MSESGTGNQQCLWLKEVIISPVIDMGEDEDDSAMEPEMVKKLVALEGARYLQRVIKENDVLGVTWGSTVYQMINYLNPAQKANTTSSLYMEV